MEDNNEEIKEIIMKSLDKRFEIGRKEYGHGVRVNDGHDWLDETLEEIMDSLVYVAAKIIQIKNLCTKKT
jgi:hypothetical protein